MSKKQQASYVCDYCNKTFYSNFSLHRHLKLVHSLVKETKPRMQSDRMKCPEQDCNKTFERTFCLQRHLRMCHGVYRVNVRKHFDNFKCLEGNCEFHGNIVDELIEHLNSIHGLETVKKQLKFSSNIDFQIWKSRIEAETKSQYVKRYGDKVDNETRRSYLYCNRTGSYVSKSVGKRKLKTRGSSKINSFCTSRISYIENLKYGSVEVNFYETHYGHGVDLQHLRNEISKSIDSSKQLAEHLNAITQIAVESDEFMETALKHVQVLHCTLKAMKHQKINNDKDITNKTKAQSSIPLLLPKTTQRNIHIVKLELSSVNK